MGHYGFVLLWWFWWNWLIIINSTLCKKFCKKKINILHSATSYYIITLLSLTKVTHYRHWAKQDFFEGRTKIIKKVYSCVLWSNVPARLTGKELIQWKFIKQLNRLLVIHLDQQQNLSSSLISAILFLYYYRVLWYIFIILLILLFILLITVNSNHILLEM